MPPATRLILGAFLTLALAMGVGRFFYTPLLPLMQRDFGFGPAAAGLLASANFAGYLAGSLAASFVPSGPPRVAAFRTAVVASVLTTVGMGLTDAMTAWLALRALAGVASAFALILAAGITAEALARAGAEGRIGWVFGGVGFGIAGSTLLVRAAGDKLSPEALWVAAGLASAALLPVIFREVRERELPPSSAGKRPRRVPRPLAFAPLMLSYFCEGLGYSVFATFIVAIVKARPGLEALADWVWVLTGLAGLPSCLMWAWVAERLGYAAALLLAFVVQIAGVLLPAVSDAAVPALVAAILFGGTFMAITFLTLPLGRHALNGRGFAVLTAGFGLGQMLGPLIAGYFVADAGDYDAALIGSAAVLALGAAALAAAMLRRRGDAGLQQP